MNRFLPLLGFVAFALSCNDHAEEIAECKQCDTLINLKVFFEDTAAANSGDTVIYILKKAPQFNPIHHSVLRQNGQKEIYIRDTIHASDSLIIYYKSISHLYYDFKRDWYSAATMFDHNFGFCGLHDYTIDGTEVNESGMALTFPK